MKWIALAPIRLRQRLQDRRLARRYMRGPGKPPTREEATRIWEKTEQGIRDGTIRVTKLSDLPYRQRNEQEQEKE